MAKVEKKKKQRQEDEVEEEVEYEYILEFRDVKFSYPGDEGKFAANGLNLAIKKGEFVSVIGHNGSGKSTLAKLCDGLLRADEGEIFLLGRSLNDPKNLKTATRHVGIVFQNPDNQTVASIVEDDVAFGPENLGLDREEIARRVDWALDAVDMTEFRDATPTRLSGGQKQRVAVAGALAIQPEILILDEATAMLDPRGRKEVVDVVQKLNRETGMTVILITHFMDEALLADRTIVLNRGEVVLSGNPDEIFEKSDELETFNLVLPRITEIGKKLEAFGMDIKNVLYPDEMAIEIEKNLRAKGIESYFPAFERDEENQGFSAGDDETSQYCVSHKDEENQGELEGESLAPCGEWDIDVEHLSYTYSKKSPFASKALNDVSLHIGTGEFFGIIGHTGSGKSTLIRHFNALIKLPSADKHYRRPKAKKGQPAPVEPSIKIGKFDLTDRKCDFMSLRSNVGMVFQYPEDQLFADTVFQDVAFGLKNFNKGISDVDVERAVRESVETVGLNYEEVKDRSPFDLSGGQRRRVAIAGILVTKPKILILDEPAAGLDPKGKKEIMDVLHSVHEDWCETVIIISHDMDEIADNCSHVAVISEGEIAMCGTPKELFSHSDDLFAMGLDVPITARISDRMREDGYVVESDFTADDFALAVKKIYEVRADAQ